MDDNLNTFFSRFGGKSRKSEQIINFFPEHNIYIEPFLGSGAIYLKKPETSLEAQFEEKDGKLKFIIFIRYCKIQKKFY